MSKNIIQHGYLNTTTVSFLINVIYYTRVILNLPPNIGPVGSSIFAAYTYLHSVVWERIGRDLFRDLHYCVIIIVKSV